jgi:hypothetical protein
MKKLNLSSEQEKKLNKFIKDSRELLRTAFHNYCIWWFYKSERKEYFEVIKKYEGFFSESIYAHFLAMLMAMTSLLDRNSKKYNSIYSYINYLKVNKLLQSDSFNLIENKLNYLSPYVKKLMILRSNVYAHISSKMNTEEAYKKADLINDDFANIIQAIADIIEIIEKDLIKSKFYYMIGSTYDDLKEILEQLKNNTNANKKA